jgi:hypothetical protein
MDYGDARNLFLKVVFIIGLLIFIVAWFFIKPNITNAESKNEKTFMFTEITEDNSGLLDINKKTQKYYYLTDTGIVYVGNDLRYGTNNDTYGTPVISSDGHFMRYDTNTNSVEIVE